MKLGRRIIGKLCHVGLAILSSCFYCRGKVLMLHWISDAEMSSDLEPYRIGQLNFKRLLKFLKAQNIIHLGEWETSDNFYALTIDDVPENFYTNAYPLLKEAGIPFTIFVNLSLLGKDGYINKEQLIEMSKCKLCTVGSHGYNHREVALLSKKDFMQDLLDSKVILETIIGQPVYMYAFPYGSYYACGLTKKYLANTIYKYAFSTVPCPITEPLLLQKYFLPRINVSKEFISSIINHEDC